VRKRVLLVEDHPDTSEIMRKELTFVGYDVLIAEDGQQAVAFAAHLLPDIIIMDMRLPKLNGFEATRRIRENPKTASIPILAVTAMTAAGDREKCRAAGCDGYLPKPFTYRELDHAVKKLFQLPELRTEHASEPTATAAESGSETR
jgi:two-component system cell cycle response regulator DivK